MSKTVDTLQTAFEADPNAIHSLIINRVPCNTALADHPSVIVEKPPVLAGEHWQVGALGLINAVLAANDLPLIAAQFTDRTGSDEPATMLGFQEYTPTKT